MAEMLKLRLMAFLLLSFSWIPLHAQEFRLADYEILSIEPNSHLPHFEPDNYGKPQHTIFRLVNIVHQSKSEVGPRLIRSAWVNIGDTSSINPYRTGPAYLNFIARANDLILRGGSVWIESTSRYTQRAGFEAQIIPSFLTREPSCLDALQKVQFAVAQDNANGK
jgi:hypothetical protein